MHNTERLLDYNARFVWNAMEEVECLFAYYTLKQTRALFLSSNANVMKDNEIE